jgi:hypothetical protein
VDASPLPWMWLRRVDKFDNYIEHEVDVMWVDKLNSYIEYEVDVSPLQWGLVGRGW